MIQNILTYIIIAAALGVAVSRLVRFFVRTARGENPGCLSCSLHHPHNVGKKNTSPLQHPGK